jgi:hypothetical protein
LFALAPASRWGYFVYPAALLGFVSMTCRERYAAAARAPAAAATAGQPAALHTNRMSCSPGAK